MLLSVGVVFCSVFGSTNIYIKIDIMGVVIMIE